MRRSNRSWRERPWSCRTGVLRLRGCQDEQDDSGGSWPRNPPRARRRFRTKHRRSAGKDGIAARIYDQRSPPGSRLRRSRDAAAKEPDLATRNRTGHRIGFKEGFCHSVGLGTKLVFSRARSGRERQVGLPSNGFYHTSQTYFLYR